LRPQTKREVDDISLMFLKEKAMPAYFKDYLSAVENALKASNATEHTHRPSLKVLLESIDLQITATNEPKRIACGAPDYIITRDGLTIGYTVAHFIQC